MYSACMVNVQIRDVPESVHQVLVDRAARAGHSLQQHLLGELTKLASRPTNAELMERIEARPKGRFELDDVLDALDEGRAGR